MYVPMLKYCHLCTTQKLLYISLHVLYILVYDTRFYIPTYVVCTLITLFCEGDEI